MARSKEKHRPMKSRKNGLKHQKRIASNNKVLSKFK